MADLYAPPHATQADQLWNELRAVTAERDEARAQRDRLLAAARRFLALLGDRAIASVQLAGKELDELRRAVR